MNNNSKELFDKLKSEIIRLHYYWIIYRQILGTNENRIQIINKTSPSFFILFQDLMLEYITLELSRLTDRSEFGKNKNLSFYYLLHQIEEDISKDFYTRLNEVLEDLKEANELFRHRRNKIVAHRDVKAVLGNNKFGISRQNVEDALKIIREYMNEIEFYFFDKQTLYEEFITDFKDDGNSLLIRLTKSIAYDDLVKQQKISQDLWENYGKLYE